MTASRLARGDLPAPPLAGRNSGSQAQEGRDGGHRLAIACTVAGESVAVSASARAERQHGGGQRGSSELLRARCELLRARCELAARLRARNPALREAIFERMCAVGTPVDRGDAPYLASLRGAVAAGLEAALEGIETGDPERPRFAPEIVDHIRLAARRGVDLEQSLRRCVAGELLLGELIMEEAPAISAETLREIARLQGPIVDRMMALLVSEHRAERERLAAEPGRRRRQIVEALLAGESADSELLGYDLRATHLALVGVGAGAKAALTALRGRLRCAALIVDQSAGCAWAWLSLAAAGGAGEVAAALRGLAGAGAAIGVGEPCAGVEGFRESHRQAQAALRVAMVREGGHARFGEHCLTAAALADELLCRHLARTYIAPLRALERGEGEVCAALRAYLDSGCNAASAASALGVDRHTIQRRVRRVEERLGKALHACLAELKLALALTELEAVPANAQPPR
ncbi:MAG TPA: helix-turn-helix domain-containing protein [Solirubrobacteraceae bacterium]|nr:helix-turn-helix domain-containing protein [Solirubrobacteraceae bacterium]